MNFTSEGYHFDTAALSEKVSRGKSHSDFAAYVATSEGDVDPAAAAEAALSYYDANHHDLIPHLQIDAEYINARHALVSVTLNQAKLDPVSFSTTGATTHLNQSLLTRGIYAAPGAVAPVYHGAIGVSDSGVAGVDITVPAFEFSVRKKFEYVSTAYLLAMVSMTGRTNSGPWSIFGSGEALFLGGEGGEDENNWVDVTYHFAARPNESSMSLGGITGISKEGWDYLWVKHGEKVVGDRVLQIPEAAYVEKVYPSGNFNVLGIN